jgi:NAD(P)-dependent dehydrogenase (short-subunit alcohol dehydrogenase family)
MVVVAPVDDGAIDVAQFDRQLAVDYTGVVTGIREAIKHKHAGGRIINIGSGAGTHVRLARDDRLHGHQGGARRLHPRRGA